MSTVDWHCVRLRNIFDSPIRNEFGETDIICGTQNSRQFYFVVYRCQTTITTITITTTPPLTTKTSITTTIITKTTTATITTTAAPITITTVTVTTTITLTTACRFWSHRWPCSTTPVRRLAASVPEVPASYRRRFRPSGTTWICQAPTAPLAPTWTTLHRWFTNIPGSWFQVCIFRTCRIYPHDPWHG